MVIRSFTHDQIKLTFLNSSMRNVETVVTYNLFEMPEFVAQQMGKPTVEDVRVWISWLESRLDNGEATAHVIDLCKKFIEGK